MDVISVEEVAQILGITGRRVRVLIADGRLPASRVGRRTYAVDRVEAQRFGRRPRPAGRPRTRGGVHPLSDPSSHPASQVNGGELV
ncbi:MAG: helix-turn-helix domain-containing protein [Candidatus Limnocylindrales bacterium]